MTPLWAPLMGGSRIGQFLSFFPQILPLHGGKRKYSAHSISLVKRSTQEVGSHGVKSPHATGVNS